MTIYNDIEGEGISDKIDHFAWDIIIKEDCEEQIPFNKIAGYIVDTLWQDITTSMRYPLAIEIRSQTKERMK